MKSLRYSEKLRIAADHNVKERDYWLNKLQGELPRSNFTYDKKSIEEYGTQYHMDEMGFKLPAALQAGLIRLCNHSDEALHVILLAGLVILLHKYTDNNDILLATPIYREDGDGDFINTVIIIRSRITVDITFKELLLQVKQEVTAANENANYPVEILFEQLGMKSSIEDEFPPDNIILLENIHDEAYIRYMNFNTIFYFSRNNEDIRGVLEYNVLLYNQAAVEKIIAHFINLLQEAVSYVEMMVSEIGVLSQSEKKQLLFDFNDTESDYPGDKCVHNLFEEQVEKTPANAAVVYKDKQITYQELNEKANQLVRILKERGVEAESIVGLMVFRSLETIIGILGILKAGGAYLPLDPGYPMERKKYMLLDSGTELVLTQGRFVDTVDGICEVIEIDDSNLYSGETKNLEKLNNSKNFAYVIYTSGSTGKPKGVIVEHSPVVNLLTALFEEYGFTRYDSYLLKTSYQFDVSVTELFGWFLGGGKLIVLEQENEKEPQKILNAIKDHRITHINFVPSMFNAFVDSLKDENISQLEPLKYIFLAGEAILPEMINKFRRKDNQVIIENLYGPTEAAVYASRFPLSGWNGTGSISIGKPLKNVKLYVLNKHKNLQPVGITGELCISGAGLARGYLNKPELTGEKFIRNPFFEGEKLYKTGDLARWFQDGSLEFLGRVDQQVKIRGYRIEPGEIESILMEHEEIKEALVKTGEDKQGDSYLCAYFVSRQHFSIDILREYLAKNLPDYMIPAYFMRLDKIPLSPNGKIDRKALPVPNQEHLNRDLEYVGPGSPVEEALVNTWQRVFGRSPVGITENFFMIGGDSIKAIQIASRLNKMGLQLEVEHILQYPTILQSAPQVKKVERMASQLLITGEVLLTPIQVWFLDFHHIAPHYYNQAVMLYSKEGFNPEGIRAVFLKIYEHHDALRMTFQQRDGAFIQVNMGLDHLLALQAFDLRDVPLAQAAAEVEARTNEIQGSIDLENGPLMKLALFHLADGDRLLIVIHHLVMDGISWRILFEDIDTLYRQYREGGQLVLPSKTDSFQRWSERLVEYANSNEFLKEKDYWAKWETLPIPVIETDHAEKENYFKDSRGLSFELNEESTGHLLKGINQAFGTEIKDILLTALGLSIKKSFGCHRLLLSLENHGREKIIKDIDISKTVGWFTTVYPLVLDIDYEDDLARQIKEVKEQLHQVPNNGIGYGILKYLTRTENKKDMHFQLRPQIIFNYLGQFSTDIKNMSFFSIAKESPGNPSSPDEKRYYDLSINALIRSGSLRVSINFSRKQYKPGTIKKFLNNYQEQLNRVISFCAGRQKRELTPSDLTYKELSIETVDRLNQQYLIEDIYILSPMQEGILFFVLYNKNTTAYFEQLSCRIHGKLDISIVKKCLSDLVGRYEILRTVFIHENLKRPVQIVLKERGVDFHYEDVREMTGGDRERYIMNFKERDRQRSFDLTKDVLMRLTILRVDEDEYEFVWSFHHILMDGWCTAVVVSDFFRIYINYRQNGEYQLPGVKPYRDYIRWLEKKDKEKSKRYWRKYLENYKYPTTLPKKKTIKTAGKEYINGQISAALDQETTGSLKKMAGINQVTLNTIMQVAWGILLAKYNNKRDVVFGAVVSGRPAEIEGIESMVGLFINTIPVRIRCGENTGFIDMLKSAQEAVIDSESHCYYPLAEIQANTLLKRKLLDHILVFQNYPVSAQIDGIMDIRNNEDQQQATFKLSRVEAFEHSNYDLMVTFFLDENLLKIRFDYNINTYDKEKLKKVLSHYIDILDQVSEKPGMRIKDIFIENRLLKVESKVFVDEQSDFGF
ncbi:MAG: amino acid adenylation domain-containing protein [Candidatus Aminicenantes bacterium]|nr:amino acid adenylation domain-containing protein [Candidatus Aminicenantes bacterium]NIM82450.1 amino acid adenylation domain-containing protein [Candidatus Aminicenantes bacterium]NIN21811.1 amino acid adenylation domain-containing protein [Candidatus Aminicenantes bacterium]NIN45603.1 amino acid adenylation domain-containing protein [Candidatus Aminicenantes bacterium]NIN88434.1 amino acid adenylation domain-containing protein [Candidatus Aminicenantes bacterium]